MKLITPSLIWSSGGIQRSKGILENRHPEIVLESNKTEDDAYEEVSAASEILSATPIFVELNQDF